MPDLQGPFSGPASSTEFQSLDTQAFLEIISAQWQAESTKLLYSSAELDEMLPRIERVSLAEVRISTIPVFGSVGEM